MEILCNPSVLTTLLLKIFHENDSLVKSFYNSEEVDFAEYLLENCKAEFRDVSYLY